MISGVIISLNEEHNIQRSVNSLKRIVDEVILVDAQSTDETRSIAQQNGAIVFNRKWEGYGSAKNFANEQASNDWILSLDADEELTDELVTEIKQLKLNEQSQYQFNIVMNYLGRKLKFTEYSPHYKPRLFNKNYYKWDERIVHEKLIPLKKSHSVFLKGTLLHFSFKDRQEHINKIDQYARLSAEELIRKGKRPSVFKRMIGPTYRFLRSYILKLGILEGKEGYYISKMGAELVRKRMAYFDELS